ncbi:TPA: hypothetical protein N0F65_005662 [Lagenidium giganteum]|uniref:Uncharacterized protein n=1 Tax=Lagenidium giganteum TaxID=4803 RepID=A0AAV2ZAG9_9STRA|nr:TPA: hypothetical protein N0F65_005662 [Lagenidium giganteum]
MHLPTLGECQQTCRAFAVDVKMMFAKGCSKWRPWPDSRTRLCTENAMLPAIAGLAMAEPAPGWFLNWANTVPPEENV